MLAVIKAVPPLVTKFGDRAPAIEQDLKELPREKQLSDFDDKQPGKLAKLMKVDVAALKEQRDMWKTAMQATDAVAADAADDYTVDTAADVAASAAAAHAPLADSAPPPPPHDPPTAPT